MASELNFRFISSPMEASFAVQDVPVVAEVCDPERRLDWEEPWADGIASPPRRKKSDSASR